MVFGVFNKKGVNNSEKNYNDSSPIYMDKYIKIYSEKKDQEKVIEDSNRIIILKFRNKIVKTKDIDFYKKLDGEFYCVIYNKKKKELSLVIDRLGLGDIFYSKKNESYLFSNSIKNLIKNGIKKEINNESLRYYLVYQFVPRPLTMFKGIVKVPAASIVDINNGLIINKYWDLKFNSVYENDERYHSNNVRKFLINSIKKNVNNLKTKKIGLLLSGGLDSSILAYVLKDLKLDLHTFTGIYPYDNSYGGNKYGNKIAKEINSKHSEIEIKTDAIKRLPELYDHMSEPLADSSMLQMHILMEEAKKTTNNIFSGEFSDILFAGMDIYVKSKISRLYWERLPKEKKVLVKNNSGSFVTEKFIEINEKLFEFKHYKYGDVSFTEDNINSIFNESIGSDFNNIELNKPILQIYNNNNFKNELDKEIYTDLKLASQRRIFHQLEPAKINNINLILPFTNNNLVEYSQKIPGELKIKGLKQKYILKEAFKEIIPNYITQRKKEGFTAPYNLWFKNNKKWVLDQFKQNSLWSVEAKNYVKNILNKNNPDYDDNNRVWILLNLSIWYQKVFSKLV